MFCIQFLTIRQTAKQEGLPEHALRGLLHQGELPGFYSGNRFYVNVEALRRKLGESAGESPVVK